jgi:predicted nucleic-acid-binding protein
MTGDDQEQTGRARAIIDGQDVFVPLTVALEVEWVLRTTYHFSRTDILTSLRIFGGMPTVTMEDGSVVATALDLVDNGMDFADALHLVKAQHCDAFATFDRKLVKAAHAAGYTFVNEA